MATQTRRDKAKREERVSTARRRAETHQGGFSRTTYKVPDGVSIWQPKAGETYTIDILPFKVGKRKFAAGITFADAGFDHYEQTFFSHPRLGPNEDAYVCSARTFDKPCFPCEYRAKIAKDGATQDEIKALYSKERQLFVVWDHGDKAKGPQLWEFSYHLFGKLLDTRIKSAKNGRYDGFYFPDKEGRTLEVTFVEKQMGTNKFAEAVSIDFTEREDDIPEEVLAKVPCLGDLIIEMPYDKLKQIFLQEPEAMDDEDDRKPAKKEEPEDDEDEDEEPAPKKKKAVEEDEDDEKPKSKKKVDDDDDDDLDEDEDEDDDDLPKKKKKPVAADYGLEKGMKVKFKGETWTIAKISGDGTSLTLEDDDDNVEKAIGPDAVKPAKAAKKEEPEDDDDDGPPKKKSKPVTKDDDEDEDDEPTPKKKKKPVDDDDDDDDDDDLDEDDD